MALTVDEVLEKIGSLGLYQIRLIFILSYIEWFNITFQIMVPTFLSAEPKWMCVPHLNNTACNFTGEFTAVDKRRCDMPREAWTFTDDFTSVVTEFDLVCDKAVLSSLSTSLVFAGWLVGAIIGGVLSDIIGRKPIMLVFCFACSLFGLFASFPHHFWLFILFRLLTGLCIGGGGMAIYVLATEFVGRRHRHAAGTSLWYSWTLALVMLAGLAYGVRDWRILSIICAAPGLPSILGWRFIPESSRYLLLKGRVTETEDVLRDIAAANKKEYPDELLYNPSADGKVQKMGDVRDLFRTKKMLHRTVVSWYAWFVNAMVYYGVSFSTPTLGGNMYLNFFLASIIEIPANYVGIWALGRFGRKRPLVYCMIIAAIASAGAVLFTMYDPGEDKGFMVGRIIMALLAKFFIFISFDAVYVYAAELFPTVIRNIGMGSSTAAARIGSFSSPYIIHLRLVHPLLPYGIMGVNALLAGLLSQTLPETKGMPTAETMDTESAEEAYVALQLADPKEKDPEEMKDLSMADAVKDTARVHLVDDKSPSSI
ncbi:organic cation transporter protein-like isoform X1 [Orbicella faveolata]|uniref:organic cation transporter protein-like isoform X1 n=1 Tax=Orbicella faveolata TaxID=48498 RepID=UPI0009E3FCC4|nr:organic cation transporter protein-like isoform X1 [Orbicella faveolata]